MPLVRIPNPSPSKTPYALETASYKPSRHDGPMYVNAIWLGRKNGVTTLSSGTLTLSTFSPNTTAQQRQALTLTETLAIYDPRYGGDAHLRWDGEYLWVNPAFPIPFFQQQTHVEKLDKILRPLLAGRYEELPEGYDGWFVKSVR